MTLDGVIQAPGQSDEDPSVGRRTYEIFAAHWPNASEEEQVLAEPLAWRNSTVLQGDVADAVAGLKREDGEDLHLIGSSRLTQTLVERDLVDEFHVMIDPLVVGGGKRLFRDDGVRRPLRLVDSQVTTTGVVVATYARAKG